MPVKIYYRFYYLSVLLCLKQGDRAGSLGELYGTVSGNLMKGTQICGWVRWACFVREISTGVPVLIAFPTCKESNNETSLSQAYTPKGRWKQGK